MPFNEFKESSIADASPLGRLASDFADFMAYIYGGNGVVESQSDKDATVYVDVPGDMRQETFESDAKEWCDEHGCSYELVNQAPQAPSPQFFMKNTKLLYPRKKDYEALAKDPRTLETAKRLWKKNWSMPFDETDPDDQEDIVLLYNSYMDELSEWKPVIVKLKLSE